MVEAGKGTHRPRLWKNALAEAAEALCFAGVAAETPNERLARGG